MRIAAKLIITLALLFVLNAQAGFHTANELHSDCQQNSFGSCISYVMGAMDGVNATQSALYCWPKQGTLGQARDVVIKWLKDNPALRAMPAGSAVIAALKEAFPTKVMWSPPQRDDSGNYTAAPMTNQKSTEKGEWVSTCNGNYVSDLSDFMIFWSLLPDNYDLRDRWFTDLKSGPQ